MPTLPTLEASTGNPQTDKVLQGLVGLLELVFPDLMKAYYLEGSLANGNQVTTSDLDLVVLTKEPIDDALDARIEQFYNSCESLMSRDLDLSVHYEGESKIVNSVLLKTASVFLYGVDTRDKIVLPSPQDYGRRVLHNAVGFMFRLRQWPEILRLPFDYPDRQAEFLGYDRRMLRGPDGLEQSSTKDMVVMSGWAATGLIAWQAGQLIGRKSDCIPAYQKFIGDEWASLLTEIQDKCRSRWQYLLPTEPTERADLRDLCKRVLAYENHIVVLYQPILVDSLERLREEKSDDWLRLVRRAGALIYPDDRVLMALHSLTGFYDEEFQAVVQESIQKLTVNK